jgi:hypothetical protein
MTPPCNTAHFASLNLESLTHGRVCCGDRARKDANKQVAAIFSMPVFKHSYEPVTRCLTRRMTLIPILVLALLLRAGFVTDILYRGDIEHFAIWINIIQARGLFHFYDPWLRMGAWDRAYPPLATLSFGAVGASYGVHVLTQASLQDPLFIVLMKLFPMACELGLIAAAYYWLRERPVLRWLIPGLLAIYPGLIVTSGWWGQHESPYTLFLVLTLLALNKDRPKLAWLLFGIAVLLKQPAAAFTPLLLVVTFRRYGLRTLVLSLGVFGILLGAVLAPFAIASGPKAALSPYLNASDAYPNMTNNAYNFWYTVASLNKGRLLKFEEKAYVDYRRLLGNFTYKQAGLAIFGVFVLLSMLGTWHDALERRELVWAAALFLGFFMLPTQVHERYIYPAAVLALLAAAQDRRLWVIAGALAWTFTYNVLSVAVAYRWPAITLGAQFLALPTAAVNIVLLVVLTHIAWYSRLRVLQLDSALSPSPASLQLQSGASD